MKRNILRAIALVVLLSSLLLVTTTVASGNSVSHTWYLDSTAHSVVSPTLVMEREQPDTPNDNIDIDSRNLTRFLYEPVISSEFIFSPSSYYTSWLQSPVTDPGYPLTKITAVILMAAGLMGLGSYTVIRRHKSTK